MEVNNILMDSNDTVSHRLWDGARKDFTSGKILNPARVSSLLTATNSIKRKCWPERFAWWRAIDSPKRNIDNSIQRNSTENPDELIELKVLMDYVKTDVISFFTRGEIGTFDGHQSTSQKFPFFFLFLVIGGS